jgi:hypothetical protein
MNTANSKQQPQIEAINAADKCCNWLQSDDDPIEHDDRMACAGFIQAAINAALAAEQERGYQAMLDEREKVTALMDKLADMQQRVNQAYENGFHDGQNK